MNFISVERVFRVQAMSWPFFRQEKRTERLTFWARTAWWDGGLPREGMGVEKLVRLCKKVRAHFAPFQILVVCHCRNKRTA